MNLRIINFEIFMNNKSVNFECSIILMTNFYDVMTSISLFESFLNRLINKN